MSPTQELESHIDFECFAALNGSTDLIGLVAPVFASQATQWMPDFADVIAQDAPEPVLHLLHQMAGCCAAICAQPLARGLRDAEHAVRAQGPAPHRAELQRLLEGVRQLNEALMSFSATRGGSSPVP